MIATIGYIQVFLEVVADKTNRSMEWLIEKNIDPIKRSRSRFQNNEWKTWKRVVN